MKYSIAVYVGAATSMMLGCAAAYNFDDHNRALQHVKDMEDASPLTQEQAIRFRSMIMGGRLKLNTEDRDILLESENEIGSNVRQLQKKHRARNSDGAPDGTARKGRARGDTGKQASSKNDGPKKDPKEKKTKNRGRTKDHEAKRSKPQGHAPPSHESGRHKPEESGRNKPDGGSSPPRNAGRNQPEGNGPSPQHSGRNKQPKHAGRHDPSNDDYYYDDDDAGSGNLDGGGGGIKYTYMYLEGFQDGRGLLGGIPPDPSLPDEFDAGATYLYNQEPVYGIYSDFAGNSSTGYVVDESDEFATVTGKCIRTDTHDELDVPGYKGRAYCQFVYTFAGTTGFDSYPDAMTAEGPIQIGDSARLTVTGGTEIFRRVVGEIYLTPVDPNPLPSIEWSYELDLPASYYMEAYLYMDSDLIASAIL